MVVDQVREAVKAVVKVASARGLDLPTSTTSLILASISRAAQRVI
jgi:hypothetical protein